MAVDTHSLQYDAMKEAGAWKLCLALLAGTPGMRAAGKEFLPKEPDEKEKDYDVRVNRSFLHNAYDETIEKYVARPFSQPATWDVANADAKALMEPIMEDMDGEGMHHQDFAKEFFRMLIRWGVSTAHTDYPEIDEPENINQGQEQADDVRPINKVLDTPSIIGWMTLEQSNGVERLQQIRVEEVYIEQKEDWEQVAHEQIRVIDFDKWTIYRRKKKKEGELRTAAEEEWVIVGTGEVRIDGVTPDELPLVTAYIKKLGLMVSLPAFLNMAWTNQELWQSMSDQKNILRFDRLGILFFSGVTEDDQKAGIKIAPTSAFMTVSPEADAKRLETNGKPAENGWKDIRDIMERLETQGMDPMIQRLANVKAAGINANEDKSRSHIESWIDATNTAMKQIIQLNLKWMGAEIDLDDITYQINQDFVFATKTANEVKDVIDIRKNGDLSHRDFLKEMQRYGRLADGDVDALVARARADTGGGITFPGREGAGAPGTPTAVGAEALGNAATENVEIGVSV